MADSSYMHDADALAQPPAKRARFDGPSRELIERPVTPVDDTDDDDLYGETPVKPSSPLKALDGDLTSVTSLSSSEVSTSAAHLALPGLGLLVSPVEHVLDVPTLPQANSNAQEATPDATQHDDHMTGPPQQLESDTVPAIPNQRSVSLEAVASPKPALTITEPVSEDPKPHEQPASAETTAQSSILLPQPGPDAASQQDTQAVANEDEFRRIAEANKLNKTAEWQLDSSEADSSSDSSDGSSDSSSDEEGEVEDTVLDPEEQARILMEGDIDEEPATAEVLRTKNEAEEQYKKPDITVTEDMKITELGNVENIVDNLVVIRANVSGEYQVLESGSLLCLADRTVLGVVADTIGRVHAPLYSVGFPDSADATAAGVAKGTTVFYVDQHSTYVFTQPLTAIKGTDASNVHDEETGDVEFSDDEAEAEYKRNLKQAKKARQDSRRDPHPDDDHRPVRRDSPPYNPPAAQRQGGGLNYSDEDEDMGMYKPLTRPDHFEDIVGVGAPIEDRSHVRRNGHQRPNRGRGDRGHGGGRGGRGDHRSPNRGRDRQRNRGGGGQRQQPPPQQQQPQRSQQQQRQPLPPQQPPQQAQRNQQQERNGPADNFRQENRNGPSRSPADKNRRQNRRERNRTSRSPNQQRNPPPNARQRSPPRPPRSVPASSPPAQSYSAPSNTSYSTASYTNPQVYAWNQNTLPAAAAQTAPQSQYNQYSQGAANPGGSIPAGAFVNPHFQQQAQAPAPTPAYSYQNPWQVPQQQAPQQQAATPNWAALAQLFQAAQQNQMQNQVQPQAQAQPTYQQATYAQPAVQSPPQQDPQAAFRAAQQQLELLRALNRGQGPQ